MDWVYITLIPLIHSSTAFAPSIASIDRVFEFYNEDYDIKDKEDAIALDNVQGKVDIENVSFYYDEEEGNQSLRQLAACPASWRRDCCRGVLLPDGAWDAHHRAWAPPGAHRRAWGARGAHRRASGSLRTRGTSTAGASATGWGPPRPARPARRAPRAPHSRRSASGRACLLAWGLPWRPAWAPPWHLAWRRRRAWSRPRRGPRWP